MPCRPPCARRASGGQTSTQVVSGSVAIHQVRYCGGKRLASGETRNCRLPRFQGESEVSQKFAASGPKHGLVRPSGALRATGGREGTCFRWKKLDRFGKLLIFRRRTEVLPMGTRATGERQDSVGRPRGKDTGNARVALGIGNVGGRPFTKPDRKSAPGNIRKSPEMGAPGAMLRVREHSVFVHALRGPELPWWISAKATPRA